MALSFCVFASSNGFSELETWEIFHQITAIHRWRCETCGTLALFVTPYLWIVTSDMRQMIWTYFNGSSGADDLVRLGVASNTSSTLWLCQQFAIENGYWNSGFTQLQNGGSFHSFLYVYQRLFHALQKWVVPMISLIISLISSQQQCPIICPGLCAETAGQTEGGAAEAETVHPWPVS